MSPARDTGNRRANPAPAADMVRDVHGLAILDGTVMPAHEARLPVTDDGLLRGDAVFEVIRLYGGRPFALDEHLERMARSAANLRLEFSPADVAADIATLVAEAGAPDGMIRVVSTRGGHRFALLEDLYDLPPTLALASVTYAPTRVLDGVKSLSYAANMLTRRLAIERGADDALLVTPHGRVLEGPTAAFFYVLDGQLHTPPLDDHILDSITRRHVLAAAPQGSERITTTDDLPLIEEAFLASTVREVHPVHAIDGRALPSAPGPVSAATAAAVRQRIDAVLAAA
jgi:branched-chain amino acid aminotransferase